MGDYEWQGHYDGMTLQGRGRLNHLEMIQFIISRSTSTEHI